MAQAGDTRTAPAPARKGQRVDPHNTEAEEALLGAAMLSTDALEAAATEVETEDFYEERHGLVHRVLRDLWEAGILRADPVLVGDELASRGELEKVGGSGALLGIQAMAPSTVNVSKYAAIVVECATLRRLIRAAREIAEMAYDAPENVAEACDMAKHMIATVDIPLGTGVPSTDAWTFLQGEDKYNWLVEGLLERRDRLIITGGEGGGKSTLLRQLYVCLAAGIHPFRYHDIPPVRVLVVDVENSAAQIRRAIEPMIAFAAARPGWNADNLRIEVRTDGLDLTQRHDSRWLLERIAANRPDVLITGPVYKLHADDPNDELPARRVSRVFDMIREKYDVAIVLEAHAAKGNQGGRNLAPFGSSLWLRWPEFGYGMRADRDAGEIDGHPGAVWFEPWRGARDQREWPVRLSGDGEEFWPWRDAAHFPTRERGERATREPNPWTTPGGRYEQAGFDA
jgi:hypothetical protein